jgi:hypothetical protein
MLTKQILDELGAEFPEEILSCKVQSYIKPKDVPGKANRFNATKALMVTYVSHTDVARRLDDVCAKYDLDWEFTETRSWIDKAGKDDGEDNDDVKGTYCCEGKLTISKFVEGVVYKVSRIGIGEGKAYKDAYSDSLKRAGVLFGIARSLYDQDNIFIPWQQDYYYKKFSVKEAKALAAAGRKAGNTRNESAGRAAQTTANLDNNKQQPPEVQWNGVLKSETEGLYKKLGVTAQEEKRAYLQEFGKRLTPENHKEFNDFLKSKIQ